MRFLKNVRSGSVCGSPATSLALSLALSLPLTALAGAVLAQAAAPPSPGAILQQRAQPPALSLKPETSGLTQPPVPQQNLPANVSVHVTSVTILGNHLIATPALKALMAPVVGQTLTLAALDAAVAKITQAYHAKGYPLAYAFLPKQQITDGQIQVRVVEPRYDKVVVAGHSRLRPSVLTGATDIAPGEVVTGAKLDRALLLLNETPGVRVNGELAAGAQPDTTTLTLLAKDQGVLVGSLSENNYGNAVTGSYLTALSLTANDPFGYGESLSANGVVSQNGDFYSGGLSANSPNVWNGLRFGLYGSSTFYRLGEKFTSLDQVGSASVVGGDAEYPLILTPKAALAARLDVYNTWLNETTHSTGTYTQQIIPIGKFSLAGSFSDAFGGFTSGTAAILRGRLNLSPASAVATDASGPQAAGEFWISQLQAQRQQTLPQGFNLLLAFSGQISGQNLDSSQKLYIGGPTGVMGFPAGVGGGDEGYLMSAKLSHLLTPARLPGALSASLLAQTGAVWINHTPYAGATGGQDLRESAIGAGLDYSLKGWTFSGILSRRVGADNPLLAPSSRYQAWFILTRSFGSPTPKAAQE